MNGDPGPDGSQVAQAAATVFGARLPVVTAYADLLTTVGVERGLIGPREAPRIWERHLLNCAGLTELLPDGVSVLDLGAGAGLPGLVLAALRPDLEIVLLEPLLRRAVFLQQVVDELGLAQVRVVRARAEQAAGTLQVDVVVARAVAPLERLVGWAMPLLPPGGRLLAQKGDRAEQEIDASRDAVHASEGTQVHIETVGEEQLCTLGRVVVVVRRAPADGGGSAGPGRARSSRRRSAPATSTTPPSSPTLPTSTGSSTGPRQQGRRARSTQDRSSARVVPQPLRPGDV